MNEIVFWTDQGTRQSKTLPSRISSDTQLETVYNHYNSCSSHVMISALRKFDTPKIIFLCLRYIEKEHFRHCVPSNVSSGLASLPLKYVWIDGKENKSWPTEPNLPTGEPLNGSLAYSKIMSYFTTNKITPMEVHELGKKQLDILYPMVSCLYA